MINNSPTNGPNVSPFDAFNDVVIDLFELISQKDCNHQKHGGAAH